MLLVGGCASVPPTKTGASVQGDDEAVATRLAVRFEELRRDQRIPGLAVVILRDTTVVLARGFGVADVERQIPVTPETPFNIASVSKPISAVVALRLAQDGVLDLWKTRLDEAAIERSPFAVAFLAAFLERKTHR